MRNILALAGLLLATPALADTWQIDAAHSNAGFAVKHMMVSTTRGSLGPIKGTVTTTGKDLTKATVEATIDVKGIDTKEPKRDEHLRSPDFFDVAKFPTATFKSTAITKHAGGYKMTGDLTMHGVTKPVSLDVVALSAEGKDPWGNTRTGTTATGKINRKDFGLVWNKTVETGGVMVGDDVAITLDIELMKPAAPAAAKK